MRINRVATNQGFVDTLLDNLNTGWQNMNKFISLLTSFVFAAHIGLFAETAQGSPVSDSQDISASTPAIPTSPVAAQITSSSSATGTAAARSSQSGRSTSWQNYVFAGTAVALATIGFIVVTMNSGQNSSSTK